MNKETVSHWDEPFLSSGAGPFTICYVLILNHMRRGLKDLELQKNQELKLFKFYALEGAAKQENNKKNISSCN